MPYCHNRTPPSYACDAGNKYKKSSTSSGNLRSYFFTKKDLSTFSLRPCGCPAQPVDIRIVIESYADGHLGLHIGISQRSGNLELVKLVLQTVKVGKVGSTVL